MSASASSLLPSLDDGVASDVDAPVVVGAADARRPTPEPAARGARIEIAASQRATERNDAGARRRLSALAIATFDGESSRDTAGEKCCARGANARALVCSAPLQSCGASCRGADSSRRAGSAAAARAGSVARGSTNESHGIVSDEVCTRMRVRASTADRAACC